MMMGKSMESVGGAGEMAEYMKENGSTVKKMGMEDGSGVEMTGLTSMKASGKMENTMGKVG